MSKPQVNSMVFKDDKGYLCAVRVDYCSEEQAVEIAKESLITEKVKRTDDYRFMYHGFGKAHDMDEYENTWWLTDRATKNSVSVYAFREV